MNNEFFVSNNMLIDNNELWMLTNKTNTIYHFSFPDLKLLSFYVLPTEKIIEYGYLTFSKRGDYIYVFPFVCEDLYVIDLKNNSIRGFKIPFLEEDRGRYGKFKIVCNNTDKLFFIGHGVKGIFTIDNSNYIRIDQQYLNDFEKMRIKPIQDEYLFSECYTRINSEIFIPLYKNSYLFVYNMENEQRKIYRVGESVRLRTISIVDYEKKEFLFTTMDDEVVLWSEKEGIIEKRSIDVLNSPEKYYMAAYGLNGKRYYIAGCERKVFYENRGKIKEISFEYPIENALPEPNQQFTATFCYGNCIYFQARSDGSLFYIDTETDKIEKLEFNVSASERNMMINEAFMNKNIDFIMQEKSWFTLNNFLEII